MCPLTAPLSARNPGRLSPGPIRASHPTILCLFIACIAGSIPSAVGSAASSAADAPPTRLRSITIQAFEKYVQLTDAQHERELAHSSGFLWVDDLAEAERSKAYAELHGGAVKIKRLETRDAGQRIPCPHGLIHHWVGVVFIPGATLDDVLHVLQDYDHHAEYYSPDVQRSKLLAHNGDAFLVFLRFRRKKIITVVLNTEHQVHYTRLDTTRAASRSSAIRIAEVENADKPDEREKTPGDDGGYLWRMETWWRIAARDGGIYLQCESASLTRDIPAGLGWLVGPFVNSIPRESLTFTLEATRRQLGKQHREQHEAP